MVFVVGGGGGGREGVCKYFSSRPKKKAYKQAYFLFCMFSPSLCRNCHSLALQSKQKKTFVFFFILPAPPSPAAPVVVVEVVVVVAIPCVKTQYRVPKSSTVSS
jgi:hypothetical protein